VKIAIVGPAGVQLEVDDICVGACERSSHPGRVSVTASGASACAPPASSLPSPSFLQLRLTPRAAMISIRDCGLPSAPLKRFSAALRPSLADEYPCPMARVRARFRAGREARESGRGRNLHLWLRSSFFPRLPSSVEDTLAGYRQRPCRTQRAASASVKSMYFRMSEPRRTAAPRRILGLGINDQVVWMS
jgi:hypothetical protein